MRSGTHTQRTHGHSHRTGSAICRLHSHGHHCRIRSLQACSTRLHWAIHAYNNATSSGGQLGRAVCPVDEALLCSEGTKLVQQPSITATRTQANNRRRARRCAVTASSCTCTSSRGNTAASSYVFSHGRYCTAREPSFGVGGDEAVTFSSSDHQKYCSAAQHSRYLGM